MRIGAMLPVAEPAARALAAARTSANAGVDELWVAEDLGLHGGVALQATILEAVPTVPVGLGIAPAAARHPAFLAMQAATLAQLHPGRVLLGIGHGMPDWMRQLGIWPGSPLARLEETFATVRALLDGDRLHLDGREVRAQGVALAAAPVEVPLYAGVRGPRSLELAARIADGVVLAGWSGPAYIRRVREQLDRQTGGRVIVASLRCAIEPTAPDEARQRLVVALERDLAGGGLDAQLDGRGTDAAAMLDEVGVAGDVDDLRRAVATWAAAGADVVLLDPVEPADLDRALLAGSAALRS